MSSIYNSCATHSTTSPLSTNYFYISGMCNRKLVGLITNWTGGGVIEEGRRQITTLVKEWNSSNSDNDEKLKVNILDLFLAYNFSVMKDL